MIFKLVHNKEDANGLFTELVYPSKMKENRFCVYVHKDDEGVVRYVGEGTEQRAKMLRRPREKSHFNFFSTSTPILEFVAKGLSKESAENLEHTIRKLHSETIFNNPYATKRVKSISFNEISDVVRYDETSHTYLTWLRKPTPRSTVYVGEPAGYFHKSSGYCYVSISHRIYSIHRLVWVLHHGTIPDGMVIDHIDNNKTNNNISNLRLCTYNQNVMNSRKMLKSNSGYKFIYKTKGGYSLSWTVLESGKRISKRFTASKHGSDDKALLAAIEYRQQLADAGIVSLKTGVDGEI